MISKETSATSFGKGSLGGKYTDDEHKGQKEDKSKITHKLQGKCQRNNRKS